MTMNKRTQFRITAGVMVVAMLILAVIAIGASGKAKLSYTSEVTVKNGAIEGDGKQAIYLKTPGDTCVFEVTAKGEASIKSEVTFYKDSTMTDSYFSTAATDTKSVSGELPIDRESMFIVVSQSLAEGVNFADGVYAVDYTIKVSGNKGTGRTVLMMALLAVVLILFLMVISFEDDKEGQVSKKQLRLRRKAYMNGFFTLVMLILSFALLSAAVEQFPFTMYQAGMISIMIAASVFYMVADQSDAYTGIRKKRSTLVFIFAVVAGINLFIAIFNLFINKSTDITPVGNGIVGDWIVNLITALCFFTMMMEMLMKNAKEGGRRTSRRYFEEEEEDYSIPKPVRKERPQRVRREEESFDDDIDF